VVLNSTIPLRSEKLSPKNYLSVGKTSNVFNMAFSRTNSPKILVRKIQDSLRRKGYTSSTFCGKNVPQQNTKTTVFHTVKARLFYSRPQIFWEKLLWNFSAPKTPRFQAANR